MSADKKGPNIDTPKLVKPVATTVEFHFIKSKDFRVIHVDGATGTVTPNRYIQMALFNERVPIPQKSVLNLSSAIESKDKATEKISESKKGVIREVEIEAIMDLSTAEALHEWLGSQIKSLKEGKNDVVSNEGHKVRLRKVVSSSDPEGKSSE